MERSCMNCASYAIGLAHGSWVGQHWYGIFKVAILPSVSGSQYAHDCTTKIATPMPNWYQHNRANTTAGKLVRVPSIERCRVWIMI